MRIKHPASALKK